MSVRAVCTVPVVCSLVDQIVLGTFSFGLALMLIRLWPPEMFGVFVVVQAFTMIVFSLQQALVGTPLMVLRSHTTTKIEDGRLVASLSAVSFAVIISAASLMWAAVGLMYENASSALPLAAAAFVSGTLIREYVRSHLFSEMKARTVLLADLAYVGIGTAGLVLIRSAHDSLNVPEVLLTLGLASAIVPVLIARAHLSQSELRFDRATLRIALDVFSKHSRWALLGVAVYELTTRVHVFIVSAAFGLAAVAVVQAGEMVFRPLALITQAWSRISIPLFARYAVASNTSASHDLLVYSFAAGIGISLLFIGAIWLAWPLLKTFVFQDEYVGIELAGLLWAIAASLRIGCEVLGARLQGEARFRELSAIGGLSALVCIGILVLTTCSFSFEWVIVALIGRNAADIILMLCTLSGGCNWPGSRPSPLQLANATTFPREQALKDR